MEFDYEIRKSVEICLKPPSLSVATDARTTLAVRARLSHRANNRVAAPQLPVINEIRLMVINKRDRCNGKRAITTRALTTVRWRDLHVETCMSATATGITLSRLKSVETESFRIPGLHVQTLGGNKISSDHHKCGRPRDLRSSDLRSDIQQLPVHQTQKQGRSQDLEYPPRR